MSFRAAAWAIDQEPANSTEKLVLICLCNNADDEIFQCWPSHDYLSKKAMCSPRTVRRAIQGLVSQGFVTIVQDRRHKGQSNVYQVNVESEASNNATGQNDLPPPVTDDLPTGHECPEGRTQESSDPAFELTPESEPIKNQSSNQVKRFQKPLPENVAVYIRSYDPSVQDPDAMALEFYDYWESVGWKRGKTPMKDWKASARQWIRNQAKFDREPAKQKQNLQTMDDADLMKLCRQHSISTHGKTRYDLIEKLRGVV